MKVIDLLHRWTGGLVGLLLAVFGLSGTILVYKDYWIAAPHARDAQIQEIDALAAAITRITTETDMPVRSILLAKKNFGLHLVRYVGEAGAYADQSGNIVARWDSKWDRVELWMFDLHHYLFFGEAGEIAGGILGLIGIGFIVTGAILWWSRRKFFSWRTAVLFWPKRMSRPAIMHNHRDLGLVWAPMLALSFFTAIMLTVPVLPDVILAPWNKGQTIAQSLGPPAVKGGVATSAPDWKALLTTARARFPDTEFRILALPAEEGDLISLRTRQQAEWLPNGRSTFWFDPADGRVVEARDAFALSSGMRFFNKTYPLHAATVGGQAFRFLTALMGLVLTLLGTLAVWTFWFRRNKPL
jgi:uncharacterized iron-regulated membrane protein